MKKPKVILVVGISLLVVAAGSYAAYRIIAAGKKDNENGDAGAEHDENILAVGNTYTPAAGAQSAYANLPLGTFPVGKGQKSKFVWILQSYLNCAFKAGLDVDGKFYDKTEAALLKYAKVKSFASQAQVQQFFLLRNNGACEQLAATKFNNAINANNIANQ